MLLLLFSLLFCYHTTLLYLFSFFFFFFEMTISPFHWGRSYKSTKKKSFFLPFSLLLPYFIFFIRSFLAFFLFCFSGHHALSHHLCFPLLFACFSPSFLKTAFIRTQGQKDRLPIESTQLLLLASFYRGYILVDSFIIVLFSIPFMSVSQISIVARHG